MGSADHVRRKEGERVSFPVDHNIGFVKQCSLLEKLQLKEVLGFSDWGVTEVRSLVKLKKWEY